jgi:NhaP-type Na+/H+ or K+/H+ antiporter
MQNFSIRPGGFNAIRKQMLIRTIPLMLIAVIVGILISTINSKNQADNVNILPFIIPFAFLAVGFGIYRGVNRQKSLLDSYTLNSTNNLIIREQLNTPTISIYFSDIREIAKLKNGSFLIKGKDPSDIIVVPAQIDNYAQLESLLNDIHQVTNKAAVSFKEKYQVLIGLLAPGLMFVVYTVSNKVVVGLAGTALLGLMTWSFIKIRQNKNLDSKTKRISWWILLVLASVITAMITKLTGGSK